MAEVEDEIVGFEDVHLRPGNERVHDDYNLRLIKESLDEHGGGRSIVLGPDNEVVAGEGTIRAAQMGKRIQNIRIIDAGPDELIAVRRKDWSPLDVARYAIRDNHTTDTSRFNDAVLATLYSQSPEALLGIMNDAEHDRLKTLAEKMRREANGKAEDDGEVEETKQARAQRVWQTKEGQLWAIPSLTMPDQFHMLMCGDARDRGDVAHLLQGARVNGVFTSPPYAEQRAKTYGSVAADAYLGWFAMVERNIYEFLQADGSFFLNIKEHVDDGRRSTYVLKLALWLAEQKEEVQPGEGWWWIDTDCWERPGMPGKQGPRFKNAWEPVYHYAKQREPKFRPENVMDLDADLTGMTQYQGAADNVILGRPDYDGAQRGRSTGLRAYKDGAYPSNVISVNKGFTENPGHGARFPIELPEFFMRAFSDPGDLWLDPFVGSGSTMIAAENSHRLSFGLDIDPLSVAVTLQQFSGLGSEPFLFEDRDGE